MKKNFVLIIQFVLFTAVIYWRPDICVSDIYKYVDNKGVIHLTNIPNHKGYKMVLKDKNNNSNIHYNEAKYDTIIKSLCKKYGVDVTLVKAVIKAESDFNPLAVSKKGALGLMQLMPDKAEELNVSDPFDPYQNMDGGIRHLRGLIDVFNGDISLALAAYNAGSSAVLKDNSIPPYKETQEYIEKVLQYKNDYYR